ncbi:MAG: prohibitin family protein [Verrucomicrobia bacterium]|nr:prohibitin family protein [Verrucomicrobiota bacterium]
MKQPPYEQPFEININPKALLRPLGVAILVFVVIIFGSTGTYIVQPGFRGVEVTLGKVTPKFKSEGFGFKQPFITHIQPVSIRQQTRTMPAECYSSDLQQVKMEVNILYRIPEQSVVRIFQEYAGDPFDSLIAPRVQEALKEVAAAQSAEMIVKKREDVKLKALDLARLKVGTNFLEIVDVVLYNIALTAELEHAIELKMVQEQEAEKAKFTQTKAQIEADTAIIRARGEADAIKVRGQALRASPDFIRLQVVQNWNGKSPLVVGADGGANLLMSVDQLNRHATPATNRPIRTAPLPGSR